MTDKKTGYVVEAKNSQQLAQAVIAYYKDDMEKNFVENVRKEAYRFSWDRLTEKVEELLQNE